MKTELWTIARNPTGEWLTAGSANSPTYEQAGEGAAQPAQAVSRESEGFITSSAR